MKKSECFQTGFRSVRKYKWMPFTNESRDDGLMLHHWVRADKVEAMQPYPFSRFNKVNSASFFGWKMAFFCYFSASTCKFFLRNGKFTDVTVKKIQFSVNFNKKFA